MRGRHLLDQMSTLGAAAQATVPGLYAWAVTVAPVAWSRGASSLAKAASLAALAALVSGVLTERRWGTVARLTSFWCFVLGCGLAWSAAPAGLGPLRMDTPRGVAGMLGWALFALVSAAPALQGRREMSRVVEEVPGRANTRIVPGDGLYVTLGALGAGALEFFGWQAAPVERALLVRLVAIAAGLGLMGASAEIALDRHLPRRPASRSSRLKSAMVPLALIAILLASGAALALYD